MILHGDCLVKLKELADNSVDLILTSPPYDNLRLYNNRHDWSFDVFKSVALDLKRILKPGGVIVWIIADATIKGSESGSSFKQALFFKDIGLNLHDTMIWNKPHVAFPDSNRYYQSFEYMFIFSKDKPKTFNAIKDHKNVSFGRKISGKDRSKNGQMIERSGSKTGHICPEFSVRRNVWTIPNSIKIKGHPAVFPEQIAIDHIFTWSNEGEIVLDPFLGSGTTAVASVKLKRNFIGIEREAEYIEIAKRRIDAA